MNIGALVDDGLTWLRRRLRLEDPGDETAERLFRALGSSVSDLVVGEVNEIYQHLIQDDPEVVAEGLQRLAQLVIRARVDFPGNEEDEVFQNVFIHLRSFVEDARLFPYFDSLFHSAVRSRNDLRKQKKLAAARRRRKSSP